MYPEIYSFQYNTLQIKMLVEIYLIVNNLGGLTTTRSFVEKSVWCGYGKSIWWKRHSEIPVECGKLFCKKIGNMGKK